MSGKEDEDKQVEHNRILRQCPLLRHAVTSCILHTFSKITSRIGTEQKCLALAFLLVSVGAAVVQVPVREFWGQDTTLLDPSDSVTLQWFIQPANATLYWIRCYIGEVTTVSRHFFTYIHSTGLFWVAENFTSFLFHSLQYGIHTPLIFSLTLGYKDKDLSGVYTCELEGAGTWEPMMASLRLRVDFGNSDPTVSKPHSNTSYYYVTRHPTSFGFDYDNTTAMSNMDKRRHFNLVVLLICISAGFAFSVCCVCGGILLNRYSGDLSKCGPLYRRLPRYIRHINSKDRCQDLSSTSDGQNEQELFISRSGDLPKITSSSEKKDHYV